MHAIAVSKPRDSVRDVGDQMALMACEDRRLRNERLQEDIRTKAAKRQLRSHVVKGGELRRNGALVFVVIILTAQAFQPESQPPTGVLIALIALAGWAIRGGSELTSRRNLAGDSDRF